MEERLFYLKKFKETMFYLTLILGTLATASNVGNKHEDGNITKPPFIAEFVLEEPFDTAYLEITSISLVPPEILPEPDATVKRTKRVSQVDDNNKEKELFLRRIEELTHFYDDTNNDGFSKFITDHASAESNSQNDAKAKIDDVAAHSLIINRNKRNSDGKLSADNFKIYTGQSANKLMNGPARSPYSSRTNNKRLATSGSRFARTGNYDKHEENDLDDTKQLDNIVIDKLNKEEAIVFAVPENQDGNIGIKRNSTQEDEYGPDDDDDNDDDDNGYDNGSVEDGFEREGNSDAHYRHHPELSTNDDKASLIKSEFEPKQHGIQNVHNPDLPHAHQAVPNTNTSVAPIPKKRESPGSSTVKQVAAENELAVIQNIHNTSLPHAQEAVPSTITSVAPIPKKRTSTESSTVKQVATVNDLARNTSPSPSDNFVLNHTRVSRGVAILPSSSNPPKMEKTYSIAVEQAAASATPTGGSTFSSISLPRLMGQNDSTAANARGEVTVSVPHTTVARGVDFVPSSASPPKMEQETYRIAAQRAMPAETVAAAAGARDEPPPESEPADGDPAASNAQSTASFSMLGNSLAFIKSLVPFFNKDAKKEERNVNIEMEIAALEEEPIVEKDLNTDFAVQRGPFEAIIRKKRQESPINGTSTPSAEKLSTKPKNGVQDQPIVNIQTLQDLFSNFAIQRDPYEAVIRKKRHGKFPYDRSSVVKRDLEDDEEPMDDLEDKPENHPDFNLRFAQMPIRRPNSDPALSHHHGRPGKAQVVDPVTMFLTVSLPTILCCALLMIFCIFFLNPRGAICTKMFSSVQGKTKRDYHQVRA